MVGHKQSQPGLPNLRLRLGLWAFPKFSLPEHTIATWLTLILPSNVRLHWGSIGYNVV